MSSPACVSVLMPCFNPGAFLADAVLSVLAQPECLELLVADGGSSDGTLTLLHQLSRSDGRIKIISGPDLGPADALNKAFSQARGTFIGWLNADDLYTSGCLSRASRALECNPHWLMVYGEGEEFQAEIGLRRRYPTLHPSVGLSGFQSHCFVCQPTVVFRRTMALRLGLFDIHYRTAFDFDYWLRAFSAFPERIGYLPVLQGLTRLHACTITSSQRSLVALEATELLYKNFGYASRNRLHCYALELRIGIASLPQSISFSEHLDDIFSRAEQWLDPLEYVRLRSDWLLDEPIELQSCINDSEGLFSNKFPDPLVSLLQVAQPHLRPDSPWPLSAFEHRLAAAIGESRSFSPLLEQLEELQAQIFERSVGKYRVALPFGINLIHEDAASLELMLWMRSFLAILERLEISFHVCRLVDGEPGPFAINIIVADPTMYARWLLSHGLKSHLNRLSISVWPLNVSGLHTSWHPLLDLLDDLWIASNTLRDAHVDGLAFSPWQLPCPPPLVHLAGFDRECIDSKSLIIVMADLSVHSHFLNLLGAIEVFRAAFPSRSLAASRGSLAVPRIRVLIENYDAGHVDAQWLKACCQDDFRVDMRILDGLSFESRVNQVSEGTALLSMRRGDAFKSSFLLAQMLGLPAIVPACSSYPDLYMVENMRYVSVRPVPVPRDVVPGAEGLQCAEPDFADAVFGLQQVVSFGKRTAPMLDDSKLLLDIQIRERIVNLWEEYRAYSAR